MFIILQGKIEAEDMQVEIQSKQLEATKPNVKVDEMEVRQDSLFTLCKF